MGYPDMRGVVVGVDGSTKDLGAVGWAAEAAACRGTSLHVLTALPRAASVTGSHVSDDHAEWVVDAAAREALAGHPGLVVDRRVVRDSAAGALARASATALLVVLGARGLGPVVGRVLGSVSQRVAADAHGPVVVVRARTPVPDRPVVAGIHPEDAGSVQVLTFAFDAASCARLPLRIVHAVPAPQTGREPELHARALELLERRAHEQGTAVMALVRPFLVRHPTVPVELVQVSGDALDALVREAAHASVVVVARHGGDPASPGLGPVSRGLLHEAPVVAIVPTPFSDAPA